MSSVIISQRALKHEQLLRRATNFKISISQAKEHRKVCIQVLHDNLPDATSDADFAADTIFGSMLAINSILSNQFLTSPMYPVSLLRDMANCFASLRMPAILLAELRDEFKHIKAPQLLSRLLAIAYEMPTDEINSVLDIFAPLRFLPLSQMLERLKSTSSENDYPQANYGVRIDVLLAQPTQSENGGSSCGEIPNFLEVANYFQRSNLPLPRRTPAVTPQNSARAVQAIYRAFKGRKLTGDALQSIDESIRDYNILAAQLVIDKNMNAKIFI